MAVSAIWAAILMLTSLCTNASGLWAGRFCLGFVEAAIAPGMTMIISMWYKRSEQALRQSVWFMGNVTGGLCGGLLGYGIGHINSIAPWKVSRAPQGCRSVCLTLLTHYFIGSFLNLWRLNIVLVHLQLVSHSK